MAHTDEFSGLIMYPWMMKTKICSRKDFTPLFIVHREAQKEAISADIDFMIHIINA